ncbi:DUF1294 domain-containing protein [Treponema sp. OMZ 788]|nr:DUF1294 domain-containing protein [Treponema sp. OMZ 788]
MIVSIVYYLWKEKTKESLNFDFFTFFKEHIFVFQILGFINILTFFLFGFDKWTAIKKRSRIKIMTLLGFSFIGGSVGGLFAMLLFRHKTKKIYFTLGLPLIMLTQGAVICFFMNVGR